MCGVTICSVRQPDVKIVTDTPPSEDKAFLPSVLPLINQSLKALLTRYGAWFLFRTPPFWDTKLMDLPVVAADLLLGEHFFRGATSGWPLMHLASCGAPSAVRA